MRPYDHHVIETPPTVVAKSNRSLVVLLILLGILLVVAIVLLVMIYNELQAQEAQRLFEDCMGRFGFYPDELPSVSTDAEASEAIDAMAEATAVCRP